MWLQSSSKRWMTINVAECWRKTVPYTETTSWEGVRVRFTTAALVCDDLSWRRWEFVMLNVTRSARYDGHRLCGIWCTVHQRIWIWTELKSNQRTVLSKGIADVGDAASDPQHYWRRIRVSARQRHRARDTVELLRRETPEFISPDMRSVNSPDLNPVDYCICGVRVYRAPIRDVVELQQQTAVAGWDTDWIPAEHRECGVT